MNTLGRRAVLISVTAATLGLTACGTAPPMDPEEVNRRVSQVDGVMSVDLLLREGGGVAGWFLEGEIGLPEDDDQARSVYNECLRAISTVPVSSGVNVAINVYGTCAGESMGPRDIDVPENTIELKEHFTWAREPPPEARAVYEDCLRAIASVSVDSGANLGMYVYGMSASGELDTDDVGAPDSTRRLKEHFK